MNDSQTVVIVGAGALGSHVLMLARNWTVDLKVIDGDKVEQKNMQSQFHTKMGLRRNKAVSLKQAMLGLFGHTRLYPVPHYLGKGNEDVLLRDAALVIDCTDNIKARSLIQSHCKEHQIPCLHGCLSADGSFARVLWTEHFVADPEGEEGEATCEDGENLPFHGLAGALIAQVAQVFLREGRKQGFQLTGSSLVRLT